MVNNVDPGFPGKPTVYPYYDPNNSTEFTVDPNAPGPLNQIPTSSTYVWGYTKGTVDTSAIPSGYAYAPGAQQASLEALRFKDGSTPSGATAATAVPMNPAQVSSPSVGGFYVDSASPHVTNPTTEPNTNLG